MIQLWAFHPVEIPADAFSLLICWTGRRSMDEEEEKKRKFDAVDDAFTEEKKKKTGERIQFV